MVYRKRLKFSTIQRADVLKFSTSFKGRRLSILKIIRKLNFLIEMILLRILESQIPSINRVLKWITQKSLKILYEANNNRHAKHLTQNFRFDSPSFSSTRAPSRTIPRNTYVYVSIHVTEFRVSSISASNSAERSDTQNTRRI